MGRHPSGLSKPHRVLAGLSPDRPNPQKPNVRDSVPSPIIEGLEWQISEGGRPRMLAAEPMQPWPNVNLIDQWRTHPSLGVEHL